MNGMAEKDNIAYTDVLCDTACAIHQRMARKYGHLRVARDERRHEEELRARWTRAAIGGTCP